MEIISSDCEIHNKYYDTNMPDKRLYIIKKYLMEKNYLVFEKNIKLSRDILSKTHCPLYIDFIEESYKSAQKYNDKDWFDGDFLIPNHFYDGTNENVIRKIPIYKQSGYFTFDHMTPISKNTADNAAKSAMNSYTAAEKLYKNREKIYYALNSSPGHHASRNSYGGYCFYNNAAIAANRLLELGANKVAIINCDYHASNGTQQIFYNSDDVLTISLHIDPLLDFPSYAGFSDEIGVAKGKYHHYNFPLPKGTDWNLYEKVLEKALNIVRHYNCDFLIIEFGADTISTDPNPSNLGGFNFTLDDYKLLGKKFSGLKIPKMITQEGGYDLERIHIQVYNFLSNIAPIFSSKL